MTRRGSTTGGARNSNRPTPEPIALQEVVVLNSA